MTRLLDMDIEPFLIASSLSGIISQRLVRCLCPECSYEDEPSPSEVVMFKKYGMTIDKVKRARGCTSCNFKGYAGRVGIFEVLPITKNFQRLIAENANVIDLTKQARNEGMMTILESGLQKIKKGVTTLEEVLKVASELE